MARNTSNVSQREIARHADVSLATVNRVMSNDPKVAEKTRDLVIKVMRDLNQGVRPKYLVGVIIPDAKNPYFTDLAFNVSDALAALGGAAVIMNSNSGLDKEIAAVEAMKSMRIDATILVPATDGTEAVVRLYNPLESPLVVLDRETTVGSVDFVASEQSQSVRAAINHLVSYGHERIGCLMGPQNTQTGVLRLKAFKDAVKSNGLTVRDEDLYNGDFDLISGRKCAENLINLSNNRPTAIFSCNDLMAISMTQRLQESGWQLPSQLSVIGFDNIEWSKWVFPTLSTIDQNVKEMAERAVEIAKMRIDEIRANAIRPDKLLDRKYVREVTMARFLPRASVTGPRLGFGIGA